MVVVQFQTFRLAHLCLRRPEPRTIDDPLALERSIAGNGILFPVVVRAVAEQVYEVIDGEVRVFKAKLLQERGSLPNGFLQVPGLLVRAPTEPERALWRLMANMHHGLPDDELEELIRAVGLPSASGQPPRKADRSDARPPPALDDLLFEISIRRHAMRSSRRMIRMLEVVRDFSDAAISLPEAVEGLRLSAGDD